MDMSRFRSAHHRLDAYRVAVELADRVEGVVERFARGHAGRVCFDVSCYVVDPQCHVYDAAGGRAEGSFPGGRSEARLPGGGRLWRSGLGGWRRSALSSWVLSSAPVSSAAHQIHNHASAIATAARLP